MLNNADKGEGPAISLSREGGGEINQLNDRFYKENFLISIEMRGEEVSLNYELTAGRKTKIKIKMETQDDSIADSLSNVKKIFFPAKCADVDKVFIWCF